MPDAKLVEKPSQLAGIAGRAGITVAKALFVFKAHAWKKTVKLFVIISALAVTHRHAEPGDDERGAMLGGLLDDGGDVFRIILEEGEHRHQSYSNRNAAAGQNLHGPQTR